MTHAEALQVVGMLVAGYTRPAMTEPTMKLYVEMLRDLDYETADRAVRRLIATSTFLPSIAEIRTAATTRDSGLPSAEEAWGIVKWAFSSLGRYREFPATTPGGALLKRVVDTIGWETLCNSENEIADRAHFFRVYSSFAERQREHAVLVGLGLEERPTLRAGGNVVRLAEVLPQLAKREGA
jgi:hypothetical protein